MRTIKLLTFALFILALSISGCKKDEVQNLANTLDAQRSAKTTKQLLAFRDNLKLKSGGSLPIDSATWYLEGLLNYENANNDHKFESLTFYSDTLVMYTSGSSMTISELSEAYLQFNDKLQAIVQSQNISNFTFDAVNITILQSGFKSGFTELIIEVGGGTNTIGIYSAFGPTDYWSWGYGGGKCDVISRPGPGSDAANELEYRFNHPVAEENLGMGYFTDLEIKHAYGEQYPDANNPGPYCDYKIFHYDATVTHIWPCLSPEELNFYLSTFPYVMNNKKPAGKTFVDVHINDMFYTDGTSIYWHQYTLQYGIFNLSSNSGN